MYLLHFHAFCITQVNLCWNMIFTDTIISNIEGMTCLKKNTGMFSSAMFAQCGNNYLSTLTL